MALKLALWVVTWRGATEEDIGRTAMPHRRGAIANWLHVYTGIMVAAGHSDEQIEAMWEQQRWLYGAEVVQGVLTLP